MVIYCKYCKGQGKSFKIVKTDLKFFSSQETSFPDSTSDHIKIEEPCEYCQGKGYIEHHKLKTYFSKTTIDFYQKLCIPENNLDQYYEVLINDLKNNLLQQLKGEIQLKVTHDHRGNIVYEASLTIKESENDL